MHLIVLYVDGKCIELTHSFAARLLRFRVENTYLMIVTVTTTAGAECQQFPWLLHAADLETWHDILFKCVPIIT